jgi:hypothetical protein
MKIRKLRPETMSDRKPDLEELRINTEMRN